MTVTVGMGTVNLKWNEREHGAYFVSRIPFSHSGERIIQCQLTHYAQHSTLYASRRISSTAAFNSTYVSFKSCGISRTSASTGMKLVSPPQRGTTWVWT